MSKNNRANIGIKNAPTSGINVTTNNILESIMHQTLAPYITAPVHTTPTVTHIDITADEETDVTSIEPAVTHAPVVATTSVFDYPDAAEADKTDSVAVESVGTQDIGEADKVVEKLKELGLLPTIKKLINKENLQDADIERAAVHIHMLTDSLTEAQAIVVNAFDNKGIDLMQYVTPAYEPVQMFYIGTQLETEQSVKDILNPEYTVLQMIELQKASNVCNIDVSVYADSKLSPAQLRILRKAYVLGVDIETLSAHATEYTWEQLDCLTSLSYEGVDIAKLIAEHGDELTVEYLRETLNQLVEAQDKVVLTLSADSKQIVKQGTDLQ